MIDDTFIRLGFSSYRRYRRFLLHIYDAQDYLDVRHPPCSEGDILALDDRLKSWEFIPKDAYLGAFSFDLTMGCYTMLYAHHSFPENRVGEQISGEQLRVAEAYEKRKGLNR